MIQLYLRPSGNVEWRIEFFLQSKGKYQRFLKTGVVSSTLGNAYEGVLDAIIEGLKESNDWLKRQITSKRMFVLSMTDEGRKIEDYPLDEYFTIEVKDEKVY